MSCILTSAVADQKPVNTLRHWSFANWQHVSVAFTPPIHLSKYCVNFLYSRGLYPINYNTFAGIKKQFLNQYYQEDVDHYTSKLRLVDTKASCENVCSALLFVNFDILNTIHIINIYIGKKC